MKRAARGVVVVVVVGLAPACSAGHATSTAKVGAAPALATVSGTVRIYGGPMLANGKMAANGNPMAAVAPLVVKQGTRIALRSKTDASGRYRVQLPAGSYTISAGCSQPEAVTVTSGENVARDLHCDVP